MPAPLRISATWSQPDRRPTVSRRSASVVWSARTTTRVWPTWAASTDAGDAIKANIRKVTNPPGKVVGSWAEAAPAVRAGEKVNYEGASSAIDFDDNGDAKTDFGVYRIKAGKWALDRVIKFGELQAS